MAIARAGGGLNVEKAEGEGGGVIGWGVDGVEVGVDGFEVDQDILEEAGKVLRVGRGRLFRGWAGGEKTGVAEDDVAVDDDVLNRALIEGFRLFFCSNLRKHFQTHF